MNRLNFVKFLMISLALFSAVGSLEASTKRRCKDILNQLRAKTVDVSLPHRQGEQDFLQRNYAGLDRARVEAAAESVREARRLLIQIVTRAGLRRTLSEPSTHSLRDESIQAMILSAWSDNPNERIARALLCFFTHWLDDPLDNTFIKTILIKRKVNFYLNPGSYIISQMPFGYLTVYLQVRKAISDLVENFDLDLFKFGIDRMVMGSVMFASVSVDAHEFFWSFHREMILRKLGRHSPVTELIRAMPTQQIALTAKTLQEIWRSMDPEISFETLTLENIIYSIALFKHNDQQELANGELETDIYLPASEYQKNLSLAMNAFSETATLVEKIKILPQIKLVTSTFERIPKRGGYYRKFIRFIVEIDNHIKDSVPGGAARGGVYWTRDASLTHY